MKQYLESSTAVYRRLSSFTHQEVG
jgi:hypothetical protein